MASQIARIESIINGATVRFLDTTAVSQSQSWTFLVNKLKELELSPQGKIIANTKNLKLLRDIKPRLIKAIKTSRYQDAVSDYLDNFKLLQKTANKFLKLESNTEAMRTTLSLTLDSVKENLLNTGITENVVLPIENVIKQGITSGSGLAEMTETLRQTVLGTDQVGGRLQRYVSQIARDALNQYHANHNTSAAQDLDMVFFTYQGAILENSRDYCRKMVADGRWFHIREIEESATMEWAGKIPGTNAGNILINRGGYNCNHQFLPVPTSAVPKYVIDRAKAKNLIDKDL